MVDDPAHVLPVAVEGEIEHLRDPAQGRIGEDRLVVEAAEHLERLVTKGAPEVIEVLIPFFGNQFVGEAWDRGV